MNTPRFLAAATLALLAAAVHAAPGQDVNLDGSTGPHKKPTVAATANRHLRTDEVPSAKTDPASVKAKADADIAARDGHPRGAHLVVQRQNLKGDAAAHAMAQQATPNSIDRATANGDIDHTEQVTDLKITLKK